MFKIFLLLTSILNVSASSLAVVSTTQSSYNEINAIEQSIKDNSWFLREEDSYLYQNKEYRNKNEILNDVMKENPLEEISTSSNPNKIMLDVNSGKLDASQVYSTKKEDYVKVYQNAYGNVLLPSCSESNFIEGCVQNNESAHDRALDSYVSPGNIRIKYSYDNSNWRDSTEEAMTAYKNAKYSDDIQSSMFYNYKGLKYNAFNQNDLQKMKAMMKPGIYYNPIDNNAGDELAKPFIEKRDNFGKTIANKINTEINSTLTNENENLYESDGFEYEMQFSIDSSAWFEIGTDPDNDVLTKDLGNGIKINCSDHKLFIEISNPAIFRSLNVDDIKNQILNINTWKEHIYKDGIWHAERFDFYTKRITLTEDISLNILTRTDADNYLNSGHPHTKIETVSFENETLNDDLNKMDVNPKLSQNVREILNWVFPNFNDKEIQWNTFLKYTWTGLTIDFKNAFMNLLADKIQAKLTQASNDDIIVNHFKQDWIYEELSNNEYFSVDSSKKYFIEKILANYSQYQDGQKFSIKELSSDIEMTYNEWLNDFYYLDTTNSELPLNEMWFVGNANDTRKTFSDVVGNNIASSIEEAKNIRAQKDNPILYKEYILYDPNGQELMISLDENQAIEQLKNNINPTFRYVNKAELKILQNNISRFTDIVSDGLYTIYRFKIDEKNYVYYNSYGNALSMYENKENLITGITKISKLFYVYSTIVNGNIQKYYWSSDEDVALIANELYNQLN